MSTDVSKILNVGKKVEIKGVGEIVVKEPNLEQTLLIIQNLLGLATKFQEADLSNNAAIIGLLMQDSDVREQAEDIVSKCSGLDDETLSNLGVSDWMRLIVAIKEVIDWEELKELFFQIVPKSALQNLTEGQDSPETTTPPSPSPE